MTMESSGPKSLSGLCSICYTEQPKYCCPRCKTQTCSLPCYKKHQQRASCNGQRNPAAFVKKSQWATPSGVDHDYNYLKSVERRIDDGAETIRDLSKIQSQNSSRFTERQRNPESSLNQYLARNHIFVQRAPTGMSRSRLNNTRVTAGDRVFWTVEWIDQSNVKSVQHDCADSMTLAQLYTDHQLRQRKAQKKLQPKNDVSEPPSKKRRKEAVNVSKPAATNPVEPVTAAGSAVHSIEGKKQSSHLVVDDSGVKVESRSGHDNEPRLESVSGETRDVFQSTASSTVQDTKVETRNDSDMAASIAYAAAAGASVAIKPGTHQHPASETLDESKHTSQPIHDQVKQHFYFHRTNIPAKATILVPFDGEKSLLNCLSGQQMQEFPSIYVLPHSPDDLPPGFMTMQAFHESRKAARSEINASAQQVTEVKAAPVFGRNSQPDPLQILQMLKRDLSAQ